MHMDDKTEFNEEWPEYDRFDDSANDEASIDDIRWDLINDHLTRTGSPLKGGDKDTLVRTMGLARCISGKIRPVNAGLLMFSDDPEKYFEGARIEMSVVSGPGCSIDNVFEGPLGFQLGCALGFVKNVVVRGKTQEDRNDRTYNWPYESVKEALVNAVCHKDYRISEPITVKVFPDRIEVMSFPGPDPRIPEERVKDMTMRSSSLRNERITGFLREMGLAEGRNTGMRKITSAMEDNGSGRPFCETDTGRTYLRTVLPVNERFLDETSETLIPRKNRRNTSDDVKTRIMEALGKGGCMTSKELCAAVGYSNVNNLFRRCLAELMEEREISFLYPLNPRDPRQKVCLVKRRPPA